MKTDMLDRKILERLFRQNYSGIFVIPVEMMPVLAKISLIGYKEHWMLCETEYAGTIRMEPESFELQGTTVTADRPQLVQSKNGSFVANVQGTPLKQFGSVTEMLTHLPLMSGGSDVFLEWFPSSDGTDGSEGMRES